ncbi:hypothetical protein [Arthrobacter sp. NPDC057013]|uniref:hypothetical protein n=1 Tax=Arthrobacter sp. NPDC057013 TaxID=3345999 RepID=UPI003635557A
MHVSHGPADYHAGKQIDESGQIEPAFTGAQVGEGDLTDQTGPCQGGGEVVLALLIEQVVLDAVGPGL